MPNILPINQIDKEDRELVGVKASSLAFLHSHQVPIPDGFVVTTKMMDEFLAEYGLVERIKTEMNFVDESDPSSLELVASRIRELIRSKNMDREMCEKIWAEYENLGKDTLVSIRSSLVDENYSRGIYPLYLNIKGEVSVTELVKEIWASQYNSEFIFKNRNVTRSKMAVVVQRMIAAEASGFLHTVDRETNNKSLMEIEAIWGIGEMLVQKKVQPDIYKIDKDKNKLIKKINRDQESYLKIEGDEIAQRKLSKKDLKKEILDQQQIDKLVEIAKQVEKNSYYPQTLEWVLHHNQIYILQTQDLEDGSKLKIEDSSPDNVMLGLEVIGKGLGVKAGISTGRVQWIEDVSDERLIDMGEIVATEEISADMLSMFAEAKGIVTVKGSIGDEIALLAAELGIPAVVGVKDLKNIVKNGQVITMDGANGYIYGGALDMRGKGVGFSRGDFLNENREAKFIMGEKINTAAKVYVNIADGRNIKTFKNLDVDGLAYIKGEAILSSLGTHPKKLIYDKKSKIIKKAIKDRLIKACNGFEGEVFYKISDYQNSSYSRLKHGAEWEVEEENRLLGYRGGIRHIGDDRVFRLEIEVVSEVFKTKKNLKLILPFLRTISELEILKNTMSEYDYNGDLWLWASSPSNLILLPEFLKRGIDGVMIDMRHLAELVLGVDSDNIDVNRVFSQMDASVLWLVEKANHFANENNIPCVLVSKYGGIYNEFVERMINVGTDGFSVPFDLVRNTRRLVSKAEEKRFG